MCDMYRHVSMFDHSLVLLQTVDGLEDLLLCFPHTCLVLAQRHFQRVLHSQIVVSFHIDHDLLHSHLLAQSNEVIRLGSILPANHETECTTTTN